MLNTFKRDAQSNTYKWANLTSILLLIIGLFIAFTLKHNTEQHNTVLLQNSLTQHLNKVSQEVVERVNKFEYGLQGLRGAINTVGLDNFRYPQNLAYFQSRDYAREFPGTRGFGVIKVVQKKDLNDFLQQAHLDRNQQFKLKQLDSPQDPLFIVQYIEPERPNVESLGLDIGSEQNRRRAALSSAIANSATLTAPITLVQADKKMNHGFLLLLPIFEPLNTQSLATPEVLGWVYTPLLINEILATLTEQNNGIKLEITDISPTNNVQFFTSSLTNTTDPSAQLAVDSRYVHQQLIQIYGRDWQITFTPSTQWIADLNLADPEQVLIITLGSTLLLIVILHSLLRYITRRMDNIRQKISLSSFIDNSSECLIGVDSSFAILNWNHSAKTIFGLSNTSYQKPIIHHLSGSIPLDALIAFFKKVARGERVNKIEFTYQPNNETEARSLVLDITPLLKDHHFLGASFTINDVSKFKLLQRQLQQHNSELKHQVDESNLEIEQANLFQQNILNSSKVVIIATDSSGVISFFSSGAEQSLRFSHDEMVGNRNLTELIKDIGLLNIENGETRAREVNTPDSKKIFKFLHHHLQQQDHLTLSCAIKQKYGDHKQVYLHVSAMKQHTLGTTGFVFVAEDLTEKNALIKQLYLVSSAVDCSDNILLWVNKDGYIVHSNKYAQQILGYSSKDIQSQNIDSILVHDSEQTWQDLKLNLLNGSNKELEYKIHTLNSPSLPVQMSATLIRFDNVEFVFIKVKNIAVQNTKVPLAATTVKSLNTEQTLPSLPRHNTGISTSANDDIEGPIEDSMKTNVDDAIEGPTEDSMKTNVGDATNAPNKNIVEDSVERYCEQQNIDYQGALSRLSNNKIVYLKALELFMEDLTQYARLDVLSTNASNEFKIMFHTLKSSSATLGFTELSHFAKQQETEIKTAENFDLAQSYITLVEQINLTLPIAQSLLTQLQGGQPVASESAVLQSTEITDDVLKLFQTLQEEIGTFNMNATNTFPQIAHILKTFEPTHYELLAHSIKNLKFQQAEEILNNIYPKLLQR
ncbi:CHASE domain-containing protein [Shewanella ulleungensis]|uniref:CHASE domain-containing protein n=1 Tax=Shewanella ulleungensis TaxID=2282699 RepID=UPI003D7BF4C6